VEDEVGGAAGCALVGPLGVIIVSVGPQEAVGADRLPTAAVEGVNVIFETDDTFG
jgi:hypothetical protein